MNGNNFLCLLPEMLLAIFSLAFLLLGMVLNRKFINIIALLVVLISALFVLKGTVFQPVMIFGSLLRSDLYTAISKFLILASCFCILFMFLVSKYKYCYEFSIIIILSVFGIMNLVSSNDLLSFYLSFELQSIALYVLACLDRKSLYSSEAGVKYFVLSTLSSCILLYGLSMLYGYSGTTEFIGIAKFISENNHLSLGFVFGVVLVFTAIFFKLSAAPFHMWSPDVYQGVPTIVMAFFIIVPKSAFVLLVIRLLKDVFLIANFHGLREIFIFVGVLSMLISAFGAIQQNNLKRIFAYGSIGHVGYMIIAISLGSSEGFASSFLYLIIYVLMNIGLFAYLLQIKDDECDISSLSNLYYRSPITAFCISLMMLSMAGIPPLAGFFTKFHILVALMRANFTILSVVIVLISVISCYYYLRIIRVMYFSKPDNCSSIVVNKSLFLVIGFVSLINVSFFLYHDILFGHLNYLFHFM